MSEYEWPGNVRQLRNFLERLYVVYPGFEVTAEDLHFEEISIKSEDNSQQMALYKLPLKDARDIVVKNFETNFLKHYLHLYNGNITKIAEKIGESRENLSRKIKRYQLKSEK